MIGIGRLFIIGLLAAIAILAAKPLPAEEIPAAPPEKVGMSSERLLEIDAAMQRHIDSGEIQGAVTMVARRGKVVHFKAHGLMDVQRGRAMTHTSGLDSSGLGSAVATLPEPGPEATLASHVPRYAGMPLDFQPGTRWGYSPRVGHDVVARIIEIVSGLPYDEFVRTRIFEPLGMTDTHFFLPPAKESRRVVIHGLDAKAKGWDEPSRYVSASGGLASTARDFLRFEQMLANGGTLPREAPPQPTVRRGNVRHPGR